MNVKLYLERISYNDISERDLSTLIKLHQAHVFAIPFENLNIHLGIPIELDLDALYQKVVDGYRGGFCYELNTLFCQFLKQLGYDSIIIAAQVSNQGQLGPTYDHMAICVKLEVNWLVDVGFGDLFVRPIEIKPNVIQFDGFHYFMVKQLSPQTFSLWMSPDKIAFEEKYVFHLVEVPIDNFQELCHLKQTSESSYFVRNVVCTKPTSLGRKTLFNNKLTLREGNQKNALLLINESEMIQVLKREFAIDISLYEDRLSDKLHFSSALNPLT